MKKILNLCIIIAFLAIIVVFAGCEEEATGDGSGGFAFELINGNTEYSISLGKAKASGEIKLPSSYKGLSVTAIANNAFASCVNLTGVTIPDKVAKIGDNAFEGCTSLVKVTFTGTISAGNFSVSSFPGDLRAKYLAEGIGVYSRISGSSTTWIGTVPGIPTGLTAAAMSSNSITVSWSSVTGAAGYVIFRSTSATGTFTEVGTSTAVSYTNTGLTASTTYYYKAAASNSGGAGGKSNAVNATTPSLITINTQPAATTNVIPGNISGSLSVSASVTGGATLSYQWYSNTTASSIGGTVINGATGSSYTIPANLALGMYYYFVEVRATGGALSVHSNVAVVLVMSPIEMVRINAGTFTMGSPTSEAYRSDDETQHQVTISKGFYMGKYEVTQEQYQAVIGVNPSFFDNSGIKYSAGYGEYATAPASGEVQGRRPVEMVTWSNAVEFCNKLSAMEGLTSAYTLAGSTVTVNWNANGYRLPTEAEWEYACRAGTTTAYNAENDICWYRSNSNSRTHEVGLKQPNAWGLYDMHGNVYEWCWDWYGTYASGAQTDPRGAASVSNRVNRGGCWDSSADSLRSAHRRGSRPWYDDQGRTTNSTRYCGFRLVRP